MLAGARRAQRPLVVGKHAQPPCDPGVIGERDRRELERLVGVDADRQLAGDAMGAVGVTRDPGAMARDPAATVALARQRTRRGAPHLPEVLVAKVEGLAAELAHGIVAERRQAVLAAVQAPSPG